MLHGKRLKNRKGAIPEEMMKVGDVIMRESKGVDGPQAPV